MEYKEQFELYAEPLKGDDHEYLQGIFLNGFNASIMAEQKLRAFTSLSELMGYALKIDEKYLLLNRFSYLISSNAGFLTERYDG